MSIIGANNKIDLTQFTIPAGEKFSSLELLVLTGMTLLPSNLSNSAISNPVSNPLKFGTPSSALNTKLNTTLPGGIVGQWAAAGGEHMSLIQFLEIIAKHIHGVYHMNEILSDTYGSCNFTTEQIRKLIAAAHEIQAGRL